MFYLLKLRLNGNLTTNELTKTIEKLMGQQHVHKELTNRKQSCRFDARGKTKYMVFKYAEGCLCTGNGGRLYTTPVTKLGFYGRRNPNHSFVNPLLNYFKMHKPKYFSSYSIGNSGSPNTGNSHGDGGPIVQPHAQFVLEGGQLKFCPKLFAVNNSGELILSTIKAHEFNMVKNIYQIFFNINFLKAAYHKLNNKDPNGLVVNDQLFLKIRDLLLTEKFKPTPAIRKIIKTGHKEREITITKNLIDKIVQSGLKILLEAIFNREFINLKYNYAYLPKLSPINAIENIKKWHGPSWLIKIDIKDCFGSIDHQILIKIIKLKINDQQIIDLIFKFLKAGISFKKKIFKNKIGVQQGAILSPIFSNIYLHKLDLFVNRIRFKFNTKKTSIPNPVYVKAKSMLRSSKNKASDYKKLRQINSTIRTGFKLYFARFCDDMLFGIWGNFKTSKRIFNLIKKFLNTKLKLTISEEKSLINSATKKKTVFLGFEIFNNIPRDFNSFLVKGKIKKRASKVLLKCFIPYDLLIQKFINNKLLTIKNNKWFINPVLHWINYSHHEILYRYNCIIRGLINYYKFGDNFFILNKFINYLLKFSCAATLSRKFKLRSFKKTFNKFGKNLKCSVSNVELLQPKSFAKKQFKNFKTNISQPFDIIKWSIRTHHLLGGPCVACGSEQQIQVHHVKKLSKFNNKLKGIAKIHSTLNRKQVSVCKSCHNKIHNGTFDKNIKF